jgi:mannose-6-phosphate isomerase-like protein (cupin superfamily)
MRIMNFSLALLSWVTAFGDLASANGVKPSNHNATIVPGHAVARDASAAPARSDGIGWTDYLNTRSGLVEVVKRTATGRAEVHRRWTDVWHVINGMATLVTGGTLVNAAENQPGELRADTVSGGKAKHIGPGDLIIIPAGVPHWVKAVEGKQLVYLVVKLPSVAAQ